MDLSVIVVTHNSEKYILPCLDSVIHAASGFQYEVLIIDNASTDRTKDLIKQRQHPLTLIVNLENQGFARAVNIGLRGSSGEFRLLMNPDVTLRSDSLVPIIDFMRENPKVGICGCRLLNEDGSLQYSKGSFPKLLSTLFRMVLPRRMRKYDLRGYDKVGGCDWVTGALMLARNQVIGEVGFLDEAYFMYYEDVDYCLQAKKAGWQVYYYPGITAFHLNPHAVSGRNDKIENHIRKSRLHFFKKNNFMGSFYLLRFVYEPILGKTRFSE
jgi:GT2 family glycosyltransferase